MAKVTIANLNTLLDDVVTSNIAVQIAQTAVTNATVQAGNAATSAQAAALSKNQIDQQVTVISGLADGINADVLAATAIKDAILALEEAIRLDADQVTLDRAAVATMLGEVLTAKSGVDVKAELIEELVEDFHTKYLGALLVAPTVSWGGMELATGMMYYDIPKNSLMIYVNANIWVPIIEAANALIATNNLSDILDKAVARTNLDVMSTSEVEAQIQADITAIKGQPLGLAELDAAGLVPASQLPSYVDDVIEVATYVALPITGESGKVYIVVADETSNGDTSSYRWTGTTYAMVSNSLTAADVKSLYESNLDTNVYTNAEKSKLSGIEVGATADQTASEILTLLKTVDGSGSGVDADLLDGQEGAYYRNASNINTGTINDAYLPDTITSSITGNAATATKLATARTISLTGDVTGNVSFDGSANVSITTTVVDDSHNHVISNVDGLQVALDSKVDKVSKQSLDSNSALRVSGTTVSLYKGDGTFDSITTQDTVYTLPTATSTVKGGIEVFSDTVQTVEASAVSTTASRTYGIQLNAAGQAVVNVPWVDTNTTTTVENVLTSTSTTNALSAAQGKALQDSKVAANAAITAGTGTKVTYDAKGLVTGSTSLVATDIPVLDASKITTGILPVLRGGTGVTTSTGTGNVVLSNSPTLTGTPEAPTAVVGTSTTQLATTAFVNAEIANDTFSKTELTMAIGNINSPLLDMPLKNSLAMKSGVGSATYTRASTATYIDRYGVLKTAAIDEPRFEKEGYLNEGASTNLLTYSEQFDNPIWTITTTIISANTIDTTDPYGTNLADKITDTVATTNFAKGQLYASFTAGVSYTMSLFVKKGTKEGVALKMGGGAFSMLPAAYFNLLTGEVTVVVGAGVSGKIDKLSNGWYRISITAIADITASTSVYAYILNTATATNTSYTGDGTGSVYFFGAQLEAMPFATSYIPTVASTVTRAGDVLSVTRANNFPNAQNNQNGFSIAFDYDLFGLLTSNQYLWALRVASTDTVNGYITNIGAIRNHCVNSYGTIGNSISPTKYLSNRLVQIQSNALMMEYADGILIDSDSNPSGMLGITTNTLTSFYIGTTAVGSPMYGHISNFRIYDKALSSTEVALA